MIKLFAICLAITMQHVVAIAPAPAPVGCSITKVCGGPTKLSASAMIDPKVINGVTIQFYACQCTNGTRAAVSQDASIIIPLGLAPSEAPAKAPAIAPATAPAKAPTTGTFDAARFAENLRSLYPTECSAINTTLLANPLTNVLHCNQTIGIGQECWSTCRNGMKALGYDCYAAVFSSGKSDPAAVGSNTTVAFDQCTHRLVYTTAKDWKPSSEYLASQGSDNEEESSTETGGAEETPAPAAPSTSAAWKLPIAQAAVILPLVVAALF